MAMPNLPTGWEKFSPIQKIDWFNQNGVTEDQLLAAGVGQSDIDWMKGQGYAGMTPQQQAAKAGLTLPTGWDKFTGDQKVDWFNENKVTPGQLQTAGVSDALVDTMEGMGYKSVSTNPVTDTATNTTAQQQATSVGLTLPACWDSYTQQQKINWYNTNKVSPETLAKAGVSQAEIDFMKGQGYTGSPTAVTANTTAIDPSQSTLSPNFSPYVYNMLAKGEAAANLPYQPFTGERFAGPSALQQRAFELAGNLQTPEEFGTAAGFAQQAFDKAAGTSYTPTQFDTGLGSLKSVAEYMSPYQQNVTDITSREMRRQADIGRQAEQARLAQAGAYGGSRQAIMEAERQRNLQQQMEDITTKGLQSAYDRAMQQRLSESQLGLEAQRGTEGSRQFGANLGLQSINPMISAASTLGNLGQQQANTGLSNLNAQLSAGATQQGFMQQPLDFGYQQFQESVKFPYQQATYMQSLLGGLPLQAAPYSSSQGQSGMFSGLQGALAGLALYNAFNPTATPK